jgi:Flp pilus assembly protein TadG
VDYFWRNRSGTTAVEFAILAPIFIAVLFSAFEVGWLVTKSTLLDRALDFAIRDIRIGSATAPKSQSAMAEAICARIYVVADCSNALTVELTKIASANDFPANDAVCVDRGAGMKPAVSFTSGARAEIMFVRACLVSDSLTPYLGIALRFLKDTKGGYSIVSSSAFMNEPGE